MIERFPTASSHTVEPAFGVMILSSLERLGARVDKDWTFEWLSEAEPSSSVITLSCSEYWELYLIRIGHASGSQITVRGISVFCSEGFRGA